MNTVHATQRPRLLYGSVILVFKEFRHRLAHNPSEHKCLWYRLAMDEGQRVGWVERSDTHQLLLWR